MLKAKKFTAHVPCHVTCKHRAGGTGPVGPAMAGPTFWQNYKILRGRAIFCLTRMASGAAKNRMLDQKRFFHARMTPSQSLMATDGALKLNYASVIFVDPGGQIDET